MPTYSDHEALNTTADVTREAEAEALDAGKIVKEGYAALEKLRAEIGWFPPDHKPYSLIVAEDDFWAAITLHRDAYARYKAAQRAEDEIRNRLNPGPCRGSVVVSTAKREEVVL